MPNRSASVPAPAPAHSRRLRVAGGVIALASTSLSAGCGVASQDVPILIAPDTTLAVAGPGPTVKPSVAPLYIFLMRKERFAPVERPGRLIDQIDVAVSVDASLDDVTDVKAPTPAERRAGFTSPFVDLLPADAFRPNAEGLGPNVVARVVDGAATVEVREFAVALRSLQPDVLRLVLGQLAYTALLGTPGVGSVSFTLDDVPVVFNGVQGVDTIIHEADLGCLGESVQCTLPTPVLPDVTTLGDLDADLPDGPTAPPPLP
jgi:hypothetical protein